MSRFAVVVLAVAAVIPALAQTTASKSERKVKEIEKQFNDARAQADVAALDHLLAEGWTITHGNGSTDTKARYLADLRSGARKFEYVRDEELSVRLYGDTAVAAGFSDSKVQYKGQPQGGPLRFTRVYVKRDGRWQMIVSHATRRQDTPTAG